MLLQPCRQLQTLQECYNVNIGWTREASCKENCRLLTSAKNLLVFSQYFRPVDVGLIITPEILESPWSLAYLVLWLCFESARVTKFSKPTLNVSILNLRRGWMNHQLGDFQVGHEKPSMLNPACCHKKTIFCPLLLFSSPHPHHTHYVPYWYTPPPFADWSNPGGEATPAATKTTTEGSNPLSKQPPLKRSKNPYSYCYLGKKNTRACPTNISTWMISLGQ